MGYGNFKTIKHLVLDEADRMLNMGFIDDLQKIFEYLPEKRQTLMFSATMPDSIRKLAKKILHDPFEISLSISKPAEGVDQKVYLAHDNQKDRLICHLLGERPEYDSIIIFTSAKIKVNEILQALRKAGFPAMGISSNLDQAQREEVLRGFRSKRIRILVATDVMSRGIDVKEINLVINYDVPHDAEDYVHRVGRTARGSSQGEAITIVNQKDMLRFKGIEDLIETSLHKLQPPAHIGAGPEWSTQRVKSSDNRNFKRKNRPKDRKQ
jgi:superfamily II DNA/RNA helicase